MAINNNRKRKLLSWVVMMAITLFSSSTVYAGDENSNRRERNYIRSGNELYDQGRYAEAEVEYKKALEANPGSEIATYNLALSLLKQSNANSAEDKNNPTKQATQMLSNLATTTSDQQLASRAYYNLGNVAFEQNQYDKSIELYKNCLRRNPDDDEARDNLRLAQKKKQEQQQQDQNQNQDQDKQQQEQQQQQQEQEQQQQEDNKDQQQPPQQDQQQNNQQQQQQQSMSQENIDQILKAMQDAEQSTQQRVNAKKAEEEERRAGARTDKNW